MSSSICWALSIILNRFEVHNISEAGSTLVIRYESGGESLCSVQPTGRNWTWSLSNEESFKQHIKFVAVIYHTWERERDRQNKGKVNRDFDFILFYIFDAEFCINLYGPCFASLLTSQAHGSSGWALHFFSTDTVTLVLESSVWLIMPCNKILSEPQCSTNICWEKVFAYTVNILLTTKICIHSSVLTVKSLYVF
jgi:hypothetical protein